MELSAACSSHTKPCVQSPGLQEGKQKDSAVANSLTKTRLRGENNYIYYNEKQLCNNRTAHLAAQTFDTFYHKVTNEKELLKTTRVSEVHSKGKKRGNPTAPKVKKAAKGSLCLFFHSNPISCKQPSLHYRKTH